jgi:hypothetical protein
MAGQTTGRMKFYMILMDDFELISADRLGKMPEAYPLKLWGKDRGQALPLRRSSVRIYGQRGKPCPYEGTRRYL